MRTPADSTTRDPAAHAAYHERVVRALRATGLGSGVALGHARAAREAIARGFELGVSPTVIARGIGRPAGGPRTRSASSTSSTAGLSFGTARGRPGGATCPTIPVEAWMLGPGEWELPPLRTCATPGMASGSATPHTGLAFGTDYNGITVGYGGNRERITVRRRDQMEGYLRESTRGALGLDAVEKMHSGTNAAGVPVVSRAEWVQVEKPRPGDGPGHAMVNMSVKFGKQKGALVRMYGWHRPDDKQFTAYHDLFELGSDTPANMGTGVGESLTRNTIRALMTLGCPRIYTVTAWAGRYVWASFGWSWYTVETATEVLEYLIEYLEDDRRAGRYALRGRSLLGEFDFASLREAKLAWRKQQLTALSWNVASLHLHDRQLGKEIHVGRILLAGITNKNDPDNYVAGEEGGPGWKGHLILRPGHPTYERARARLKL